jgi:TatA/E family protein of Tat protein translocase
MPQLGPFELLIVFVIFLIFFGAGKLGDLGGAVRRSISEFKANASLNKPKRSHEQKPEQKPLT